MEKQEPARLGPIPADAGEPQLGREVMHHKRAYPRGRGGA